LHGRFRNETEFSLDALPEAPMAKNSMLNLRRQTTNKLNDKIMIENHLHDDAIGLWMLTLRIGECPSNSPFLKDNGAEAHCF
jgi:hypothetical protein